MLLLAPLAAVPEEDDLAEGVEGVLAETTVADACLVYRAIRLAQPGGWARSPNRTLAVEPTMPLAHVMALAAERDSIALQYANGFREVLGEGLPAYSGRCRRGHALETAIVAAYLHLAGAASRLAHPRKHGSALRRVSRRAARCLTRAGPRRGRRASLRRFRPTGCGAGQPIQSRNNRRPGHGGLICRPERRDQSVRHFARKLGGIRKTSWRRRPSKGTIQSGHRRVW